MLNSAAAKPLALTLSPDMSRSITGPQFTQVVLERLRQRTEVRLSDHFLDITPYTEKMMMQEAVDGLVVGLEMDILAEPPRRHIIRTPKTWWDHFKESHFPKWTLEHWPVEYNCYDIRLDVMYPGFKPALPDKRSKVVITVSHGFHDPDGIHHTFDVEMDRYQKFRKALDDFYSEWKHSGHPPDLESFRRGWDMASERL